VCMEGDEVSECKVSQEISVPAKEDLSWQHLREGIPRDSDVSTQRDRIIDYWLNFGEVPQKRIIDHWLDFGGDLLLKRIIDHWLNSRE
jgi:hypothetical protein